MKKTIFLFLVFCAALMVNAQAQNDEPTAILQHGDQATVYTGVNAFQLAYNAAGIGDAERGTLVLIIRAAVETAVVDAGNVKARNRLLVSSQNTAVIVCLDAAEGRPDRPERPHS